MLSKDTPQGCREGQCQPKAKNPVGCQDGHHQPEVEKSAEEPDHRQGREGYTQNSQKEAQEMGQHTDQEGQIQKRKHEDSNGAKKTTGDRRTAGAKVVPKDALEQPKSRKRKGPNPQWPAYVLHMRGIDGPKQKENEAIGFPKSFDILKDTTDIPSEERDNFDNFRQVEKGPEWDRGYEQPETDPIPEQKKHSDTGAEKPETENTENQHQNQQVSITNSARPIIEPQSLDTRIQLYVKSKWKMHISKPTQHYPTDCVILWTQWMDNLRPCRNN